MKKRKTAASQRREALTLKKNEKRKSRNPRLQEEDDLYDRDDLLNNQLISLGIDGGYLSYLSCDSTNNVLKQFSHCILMRESRSNNSFVKAPTLTDNFDEWMIEKLAPENLPCVITANEQTAGRGRQLNTWWTGPGSLAFSMLLNAKQHGLKPQHSAQLSLAIGYATIQALRAITEEILVAAMPNFEICWPNDVYVNGRKITGILIEAPNMHHIIIGIGVNTNNSAEDAPEEICDKIMTLRDVLGREIDQPRFIYLLCREIMEILKYFPSQLPQLIEKVERELFQIGKMVNILGENEQIAGKCPGLNPDGSLRVLTETCERAVVSGVVV